MDTDRLVFLRFLDRLSKIEVLVKVDGVVMDEDDVQLVDDPYYDDVKVKEFRMKKDKGVRKPKG